MAMNSLVVQWFKDLELSLQHLGSLLWHGYDPGAGKKKKKKKYKGLEGRISYILQLIAKNVPLSMS